MSIFRRLSILNTVVLVLAVLSHDWFLLAAAGLAILDTLAWAIWERRS